MEPGCEPSLEPGWDPLLEPGCGPAAWHWNFSVEVQRGISLVMSESDLEVQIQFQLHCINSLSVEGQTTH